MKDHSSIDADNSLPPPATGRRRWVTVFLALLIFAAGLVSGAGFVAIFAVHRLQHAIQHPEEAPARLATLLERRLGINAEQKNQVESIVARRQVKLMAIRREVQPQVKQQLEQLREEIGKVLTDAQRQRWTKLFDELVERWMPLVPPVDTKP